MLNDREVADLLRNHFGEDGDGCWDDVQDALEWREPTNNVIPDLGTVTLVESSGGEGQGDQASMVFKIVSTHLGLLSTVSYYRLDGFYSSYGGKEWDGDLYRVTPQEKTITVYEKVSD